MLHSGKVVLAHGLRGNPNEQRTPLANRAIQVSPAFKLGDAVRAPAPAEKIDDQRAQSQQIWASDDAAGGVWKGKFRSLASQQAGSFLYPCRVEFRHRAFTYLKTLGLDKVPRVGRDLVELVLQFRHKALNI